ncbi:MAG: glycosyltransferase [Oscillospiraceae bacterium]
MLRSYQITQPIRTVPTGLKMGAFLAPLPPEKRTVLRRALGLREGDLALTYIGRLAQEKSIGELLRFLPDTPQNVRLLLVGDGPYREKLEAQVRELGIAGRVIFSGMAAPERVADYYSGRRYFRQRIPQRNAGTDLYRGNGLRPAAPVP